MTGLPFFASYAFALSIRDSWYDATWLQYFFLPYSHRLLVRFSRLFRIDAISLLFITVDIFVQGRANVIVDL